ncbi:hypothetical protein BsWGS_28791 [Bradybaena similaris]
MDISHWPLNVSTHELYSCGGRCQHMPLDANDTHTHAPTHTPHTHTTTSSTHTHNDQLHTHELYSFPQRFYHQLISVGKSTCSTYPDLIIIITFSQSIKNLVTDNCQNDDIFYTVFTKKVVIITAIAN